MTVAITLEKKKSLPITKDILVSSQYALPIDLLEIYGYVKQYVIYVKEFIENLIKKNLTENK